MFNGIVVKSKFKRCAVDHSVFIRTCASGSVIPIVYINDIILTESDTIGIAETKKHSSKHFVIKDMGRPRYFLGIKFVYGHNKVALFQRKYVLDLLQKTYLLGCKLESTPRLQISGIVLQSLLKMLANIGKLIYLTVTRADISYVVGLLSQFMHEPRLIH